MPPPHVSVPSHPPSRKQLPPTQATWQLIEYQGESDFKRFRIKNTALIQTIVDHLRNWDYVVVLGAPFSEKTRLLQDVEAEITGQPAFRTLYLNLWQTRYDNEGVFFSSLEQLTRNYRPSTAVTNPMRAAALPATPPVTDARSFQHFIEMLLQAEQQHLVLFVDHLQAIPHDLVKSLLTALRALRTELAPAAPHQIMAVVTGGYNLVDLSLGNTSPFNIAKRVVVEPLSEPQSRHLIERTLQSYGIPYTPNAIAQMLTDAGGDTYLIPRLCEFCHDLSKGYTQPKITQTVVHQAIARLLERDELLQPIRDALPLIEEDADTLLDVLTILRKGALPQNQARQEIVRTGVSRLQLCGAVLIKQRRYLIKNELYRRALQMHFTATHVARVLRMGGRWEDAIDHLANVAAGALSEDARVDLLEAIVQSIYAADTLDQAYALMAKGLELGFHLPDVVVYRANASRQELQLVYPEHNSSTQPPVISLAALDQIEARTFASGEYSLRSQPQDLRLVSALVPEKRPIGIVVVDHLPPHKQHTGLPPQLPALQRFLRYAAGAIDDVMLRSAFREISHAVLNAGEVHKNLQRVLEIVTNAVGGDIAAFYLFDAALAQLVCMATVGRQLTDGEKLSAPIALAGNHPAARCFQQAEARPGSPRSVHLIDRTLPEFLRVFLPLQAAGSRLGILQVGYERTQGTHFNEDDIDRLHTFAEQVAIAVYNMQLLQRTEEALDRSVHELEKLQEISRTLTSTVNVETVLTQIIEAMRTLFTDAHVTMWEWDTGTQEFRVLASSLQDTAYRQLTLDATSVAWQVLQQQSLQVIAECTHVIHPITRAALQQGALDKLVVVPLTSKGNALGVIALYTKAQQHVDDTHQALLMAIAAQAATALENARQFAALQEAERKLLHSRDQDLLSLSQVLLHRLGNTGDVTYQLQKIETDVRSEPARQAVKHVEQRVLRLLDLLSSLRTVVQFEALTLEPIDLKHLIETAFQRCASCHAHTLRYQAAFDPIEIEGDRGALSDAFQSVLENGCEAMAGGGQIAVVVALVNQERVSIQISDTGTGIQPAYQPKIFDLGFTTKTDERHGRGRGLFTCRAILRKHRGDIELVETGSAGTTFQIILPYMTGSRR